MLTYVLLHLSEQNEEGKELGWYENELEWYFEEHLTFPFTQKVRAQHAALSITTYGEALFKQVFNNPDLYADYRNIRDSGLSNLHIEIEGSPSFQALHWEALKDPSISQAFVLQGIIIRKNVKRQTLPATFRPSPIINLLIVTARPAGRHDVGYRTISRPMVETLKSVKLPVQIESLRPGTYRAFENHLREVTAQHGEGYYHVIHFDVHGSLLTYDQLQQGKEASRFVFHRRYAREDLQPYQGIKAFLAFQGEQRDNQSDLVEASELADLLVKYQIPVTILNACQSGKQVGERETSLGSYLVQAGVQFVLAMGYSVTVSAAELLMKTFYEKLFAHVDLPLAIRDGRTELYNHKERPAYFDQKIDLEDWLLPVVYQNQAQRLQTREFTQEEWKTYQERQAELNRYQVLEPAYGFVGRDLDILQIERLLLTKRNLLLLRGMGGAGKTTLLQHLRAWWRTTEFVKRVFYFGYDERAWTRQQILVALAKVLFDQVQYMRDFQPLSLEGQQALLVGKLRAERHLLVLDNLESITGTHLAIRHTLSKKERQALHSFLSALSGGHTLVLLGSRSGEEWLASHTFEDNVYDLLGLDPEAASVLADRILEKYHATRYRHDDDLKHLLSLLDGFPLALEVVLANLAHQTPNDVLKALKAGEATMNVGDSEKRTENILRCIDYSHSNLSSEAQHLLLCLAPFTSVIDTALLENYTTHLQQQPALASLQFERWSEVLREALNWGLLRPDPAIARFLHPQPILPYFLRTRLYAPEQTEVQQSIETAFREHYKQVGGKLWQLLSSKDADKRKVGQLLTGLEYENLVTALNLALAAHVSILGFHRALMRYVEATQEKQRGLELYQMILKRYEQYPADQLTGSLGLELVYIIGTLANWQRDLKQYRVAESSYQKLLKVISQLKRITDQVKDDLEANAYHNLGTVAQEQRQFQQAEQYYQQALQIKIEYNDRYGQASTYNHLGIIAQEQRQFQQAEQYYQQALQIFVEYNDHYGQAGTYDNLGMMAQEQRQWQQASGYFLTALKMFVDINDSSSGGFVLRNLARLWQVSNEKDLPAVIASILGSTVQEVETLLIEMSEETSGEAGNA